MSDHARETPRKVFSSPYVNCHIDRKVWDELSKRFIECMVAEVEGQDIQEGDEVFWT